ncbi:hypothetical protein KJ966_06970 [bacterium]|nr:hypothetical protein [bacterium]
MHTKTAETQPGSQLSGFKSKFGEIIRHVTLSRIQLYSDRQDFKIAELQETSPHGYVFANSMSMIIVAGKSIRIILKTHFNHKDSKPIARHLYGLEQVDDNKSFDVMKEYCNLSAGFLKKICIEQNIAVGISLPVVTMGFNEVFTDLNGQEQKMIFEDCWKLTYAEGDIICSCHVDIFEPEILNNLMEFAATDLDEDNDEEYEFL